MPSNSTGPGNDIAPVAVADSFTLNAAQASAVSTTAIFYVDQDPTSPTYGQTLELDTDVYGSVIDVTANDTDANPNDAGHFWIFGLTQPVDSHGNPVGQVTIETAPDGHQVLRFYDPTPDETQDTIVTFSYRAGDQWATQDPASWATTVSPAVTVTVKITGNPVPGQILNGLNHSQTLTPDSGDPRVLYHLAGNDQLNGGNSGDTINGGAGADTIHGNNGVDSVNGGDGNDRVYGDNGTDTIDGGNGDDTLTGGNGPDTFVFGYAFGHDVITDFDTHNDNLVVDHNMWGTAEDFLAHAQQVGKDIVVTSDFDNYTITFQNVTLKALSAAADGFLFV